MDGQDLLFKIWLLDYDLEQFNYKRKPHQLYRSTWLMNPFCQIMIPLQLVMADTVDFISK